MTAVSKISHANVLKSIDHEFCAMFSMDVPCRCADTIISLHKPRSKRNRPTKSAEIFPSKNPRENIIRLGGHTNPCAADSVIRHGATEFRSRESVDCTPLRCCHVTKGLRARARQPAARRAPACTTRRTESDVPTPRNGEQFAPRTRRAGTRRGGRARSAHSPGGWAPRMLEPGGSGMERASRARPRPSRHKRPQRRKSARAFCHPTPVRGVDESAGAAAHAAMPSTPRTHRQPPKSCAEQGTRSAGYGATGQRARTRAAAPDLGTPPLVFGLGRFQHQQQQDMVSNLPWSVPGPGRLAESRRWLVD